MFCPQCGKQVDEVDRFCRSCGRSLSTGRPTLAEIPGGSGAAGPAVEAEQPTKRSGEATASLILGLFSFIPIVGLLAVIFGHMAEASIRRSGGRLLGEGMAVLGLLLGYLGLAGWVIYGASIVVHPFLPSTIREGNRAEAMGALRTINTAAITYSTTYYQGFPPSLAALGPVKTANPNASIQERVAEIEKAANMEAAGLIDEVLASGTKYQYRFTYVPGKKVKYSNLDRPASIETYTVEADPIDPDEMTHYFTDQSGVIREEWDKPATKESMPIIVP